MLLRLGISNFTHEVHAKEIVHRELQGVSNLYYARMFNQSTTLQSNIMVDYENGFVVARISNFGSAKLLDPALNQVINSTRSASNAWQPPEYTNPEIYANPKSSYDMWSFGCTILEVGVC